MISNVAVTCSVASLSDAAKKIAQDLELPFTKNIDEIFPVYLVLTPEHLQLQSSGPSAPGPVYVDFVGGALGHRLRFGGGRRQLIGRAVGVTPKKTLTVLDVTAGLGRDAYLLANMGCDVTMIESSAVIVALLQDGLKRASSESHLKLKLVADDSVHYLQQLKEDEFPDVIYLDPMFPALKKSAAVKKEMRVLKQVVGEGQDSEALFKIALKAAKKRVVVKRHRHAATINDANPDLVFEGKSTRFDVYLAT